MISFYLKSGYHYIETHPVHYRFLGFAWKFPGEFYTRYFVFTVLPFGLSYASYIFNQMSYFCDLSLKTFLTCSFAIKKHFYFFFGSRNFVYETIAMRNFRP